MKNKTYYTLLALTLAIAPTLSAQKTSDRSDKAKFEEAKSGYYKDVIMKDINAVKSEKKADPPRRIFRMDMSGMDVPKSASEFKTVWKTPVISQGNTGTCWCYSTSSYLETEIKRQTNKDVKLAELYTVYWEYVEKARRFVRERGNSHFDEGSEANAVTRIMKEYGIVPRSAYTGLKNGEKFNDHETMVNEMKAYLQSVKTQNAWNEEQVLATIKSILNFYLGAPPTQFTVDGATYTPLQYMKDVLKFNPDDYVDIMSLMQYPYWTKAEYDVPDNWWNDASYNNVPLDVFTEALRSAVKNGYSVVIGGDVSEPGFNAMPNVVMVPSFDIPASAINEYSRQFRFSNGTTTDDHGMHLVGWKEQNGAMWYLVKDSGSGSRNCGEGNENFGYYFFHEDYIKLKIMDFMVHKDAVKDILAKMK